MLKFLFTWTVSGGAILLALSMIWLLSDSDFWMAWRDLRDGAWVLMARYGVIFGFLFAVSSCIEDNDKEPHR